MSNKPSNAKRFLAAREGSVAVAFTLATVAVLGITGLAIDFGRATATKSRLQAAVDAAAAAAAALPATANQNREAMAKRIFKGNTDGTTLAGLQPHIVASNAAVIVEAKVKQKSLIAQTFGMTEIELSAVSTARSQVQNGGVVCLLALNPRTEDGLHLQGINKVSSPNCWAWVNSTHSTAINAVGAAMGTGQGFCSAGGSSGGEHFYPMPFTGCEPMADPFHEKFASYTPAGANVCTHSNLQLKNGTHVLTPGTYCGNTELKPQADVTFMPGVYVFRDGSLTAQAGSTMRGNGVTFFFYGKDTRLEIRGGASADLKAPKDGFFGGFVMVDRKLDWYDASIRETVIQGGGSLKIEGVVYAPQWKVNISGSSDVNQAANYFAMIADSFYMEGNGKLHVKSDAAAADLPSVMPKIKNGPVLLH